MKIKIPLLQTLGLAWMCLIPMGAETRATPSGQDPFEVVEKIFGANLYLHQLGPQEVCQSQLYRLVHQLNQTEPIQKGRLHLGIFDQIAPLYKKEGLSRTFINEILEATASYYIGLTNLKPFAPVRSFMSQGVAQRKLLVCLVAGECEFYHQGPIIPFLVLNHEPFEQDPLSVLSVALPEGEEEPLDFGYNMVAAIDFLYFHTLFNQWLRSEHRRRMLPELPSTLVFAFDDLTRASNGRFQLRGDEATRPLGIVLLLARQGLRRYHLPPPDQSGMKVDWQLYNQIEYRKFERYRPEEFGFMNRHFGWESYEWIDKAMELTAKMEWRAQNGAPLN